MAASGRMRSVTKLLHKLASLSPREWVDLLRAQVALLAAQVLVWTRPTGRLVSHAGSADGPTSSMPMVEPALMDRAQPHGLVVSGAGKCVVYPPLLLAPALPGRRLLHGHRSND